jgi:four helix bundle protein
MIRAPDSPDMPPYDLRDRTLAFAIDVVRWCAKNNKGAVMEPLVKQLVRSGTGVGANYRSARRGRSRREFVARLAIAHEEADEAVYWLTVIITALRSDDATAAQLLDEAEQLCRIIGKSRKSASGPTDNP